MSDSEAPKTPKVAVKAAWPGPGSTRPPLAPAAPDALRARACSRTLLLCDFDKTLTDHDAGAHGCPSQVLACAVECTMGDRNPLMG